jgi:predicted RNase H-like nuclease (RuvC/YqgF family)
VSNIPSVIKNLKLRITNLENYNSGLANESCEQQAKIAELEKELSALRCVAQSSRPGQGFFTIDQVESLKEQE